VEHVMGSADATFFRHVAKLDHWLRVPPTMRTAKEAVAWTFGQAPESYDPIVET
jgi:hypothetical protein